MIEKLKWDEQPEDAAKEVQNLIDQLVDAVNELQGHIKFLDERIRTKNFMVDVDKTNPISKYYIDIEEQRKWEGKLCWFWDEDPEDKIVDVLSCIDISDKYPYVMCDHQVHYKHCEPVKPDDDIIYKGGK